jgi:hypothetical protein
MDNVQIVFRLTAIYQVQNPLDLTTVYVQNVLHSFQKDIGDSTYCLHGLMRLFLLDSQQLSVLILSNLTHIPVS